MKRVSVALLCLIAGCSVEGKLQLGDACLTSRECAVGLVCEFNAVGNARCARAVTSDAAPSPDAAPTDATAPADAGADAPADAPGDAPGDARPEASLDVPADVPADVRPDVVIADVSDVTDPSDAAPRDAATDAPEGKDARADVSSDGG